MRTLSRAALMLSVLALLAAPSAAAFSLFPPAHSPVQKDWQRLFTQVFWVAFVVFVLVEGLLLYAIIRFRRRKTGPQEGAAIHGHTKMEIAWTIAPTLVMAWLLVASLNQLERVDHPANPDFTVQVVGHQFYWEFFYPPDYSNSTRDNLYVEQGKTVGLDIIGTDVIHAFNVPQLGVMIDAVPGHVNHFWFKADQAGDYPAQCRELCGVGHGRMHATVHVFAPGTQELPYGKPAAATNATAPTNATTSPSPANGTAAPNATASSAPTGPTTDVTLDSFVITPKELKAEPGATMALKVTNKAGITHNLYIGKYNSGGDSVEAKWKTKDLAGGQSDILSITLPSDPGAWEWWCNIPGHKDAGMYGTFSTGGTLGPIQKPILPGPSVAFAVLALIAGVVIVRRRRA